jgi:hypothetical protein
VKLRYFGDCSSITGVEAVRKTEGQAYLLRQTRFCVCLSKVVAVLLPGAEATCQPKPNGWLWLHICLTRGFSDRLFDRGKDATLSYFAGLTSAARGEAWRIDIVLLSH